MHKDKYSPLAEQNNDQCNPEKSITLRSIVVHSRGIFIDIEKRKEDFWIFLGEMVGWGRFSNTRVQLQSATPAV